PRARRSRRGAAPVVVDGILFVPRGAPLAGAVQCLLGLVVGLVGAEPLLVRAALGRLHSFVAQTPVERSGHAHLPGWRLRPVSPTVDHTRRPGSCARLCTPWRAPPRTAWRCCVLLVFAYE